MMHQHESPVASDADHWLAYRYLTGDLTDAETALVEARLADDIKLQSALAETVSLTTGLSRMAAPASLSSQSPYRRSTSAHWPVGLTAAACLMGLGLLLQSALVTPDRLALHDAGLDDASTVLAMWSALGTDVSGDPRGEDHGRHPDEGADVSEVDVPNWMLLAVLDDADDGADADPVQEGQL